MRNPPKTEHDQCETLYVTVYLPLWPETHTPTVHILSGDLTQHKRTMAPFKSLVYGLRRYDLDRCIAVATSSAEDPAAASAASQQVVGYMSHKSKVYLADVHDHVEYILSSLDMFAGISENLINYTFNVRILSVLLLWSLIDRSPQMASYKMNQGMWVVWSALWFAKVHCVSGID